MPNPYEEFQTDPYAEFGGSHVETKIESKPDSRSFRDFVTSPNGFIRQGLNRAVEGAKTAYNTPGFDAKLKGASEVVRGVGTSMIPAAIPFAIASPLTTAVRVAMGTVGQFLGEKASNALGLGDGTSSLIGDALGARAASFKSPETNFRFSDLRKIQAPTASTMGHTAAAAVLPFGSYHKTMAAKGIADMFSPVKDAISNRKGIDLDSQLRGISPMKSFDKGGNEPLPEPTYTDKPLTGYKKPKPEVKLGSPQMPEGLDFTPEPEVKEVKPVYEDLPEPTYTDAPLSGYKKVEQPKNLGSPKLPDWMTSEDFSPEPEIKPVYEDLPAPTYTDKPLTGYRKVEQPKILGSPRYPEGLTAEDFSPTPFKKVERKPALRIEKTPESLADTEIGPTPKPAWRVRAKVPASAPKTLQVKPVSHERGQGQGSAVTPGTAPNAAMSGELNTSSIRPILPRMKETPKGTPDNPTVNEVISNSTIPKSLSDRIEKGNQIMIVNSTNKIKDVIKNLKGLRNEDYPNGIQTKEEFQALGPEKRNALVKDILHEETSYYPKEHPTKAGKEITVKGARKYPRGFTETSLPDYLEMWDKIK